jgi:hypothetical protein
VTAIHPAALTRLGGAYTRRMGATQRGKRARMARITAEALIERLADWGVESMFSDGFREPVGGVLASGLSRAGLGWSCVPPTWTSTASRRRCT